MFRRVRIRHLRRHCLTHAKQPMSSGDISCWILARARAVLAVTRQVSGRDGPEERLLQAPLQLAAPGW